ncbi:MAG: DegT/DnrJ/EryC1/StrS family aminotransferase [Deltaproteobacteria bacterium]|nr:DegT/DnrJ/EryC1/StrS family aminotransferase [Deltaproteobacteria bacterium]
MAGVKVPYLNFPEEYRRYQKQMLGAVTRILERGDFIMGNDVATFESEFAKLSGTRHAIGVANGTDALVLALKVLGIGPGDEVLTAANSFLATAAAIALVGAKPVFADVEDDQGISPKAIEKAIGPKTKALLPVHLTGRCCDLTPILKIATKHHLHVIEDAAQSVGASVDGIKAGGGGILGCFSLHPLKNLNACGDAGIITTNDDGLANRLRLLRNHGLKNRDEVDFWGVNSRLDSLQAAILLTRLPVLASTIEKRRALAKRYTDALSKFVRCPSDSANRPHTYHVYVIQTQHRDELKDFLAARGIDTKIHYPIPIHLQKAAAYLEYHPGSLPNTERQAKQILSLPINQYLSEEQLDWVIESVRAFFSKLSSI